MLAGKVNLSLSLYTSQVLDYDRLFAAEKWHWLSSSYLLASSSTDNFAAEDGCVWLSLLRSITRLLRISARLRLIVNPHRHAVLCQDYVNQQGTMSGIAYGICSLLLRSVEHSNDHPSKRGTAHVHDGAPAPSSTVRVKLDEQSYKKLRRRDTSLTELLITQDFFLLDEERKGKLAKGRDTLEALSLAKSRPEALWSSVQSALVHHGHLEHLEIHYVSFEHNRKWLYRLLVRVPTLAKLTLFGCRIDNQGASMIAKGLEQNATLTHLSLDANLIFNEGAIALATVLCVNQTLVDLSLAYNFIMNEGGGAFAKTLVQNTCLIRLELSHNCITVVGSLTRALEQNTTLQELGIAYNRHYRAYQHLGDAGASAFGATLKHNHSALRVLKLGGSHIGPKGAAALASELAHNTSLKELYLDRNPIRQEGLASIATALKTNTCLEILSINGIMFRQQSNETRAPEILLETAQTNTVIEQIRNEYIITPECAFYLHLNRGLRRILRDDQFPLALWPLVFQRAAREPLRTRLNLVHYIVQEETILFQKASSS